MMSDSDKKNIKDGEWKARGKQNQTKKEKETYRLGESW
jgi:hypothetical protein